MEKSMAKGLLVTFEGIDGSGKSSLIAALEECCKKAQIDYLETREPGGTKAAEAMRGVLIAHADALPVMAELLLLYAARMDHIVQKLIPALASNHVVLCDRYFDASYAYQCGARGVAPEILEVLDRWVVKEVEPDLTFFLDAPLEVCAYRRAHRSFGHAYDGHDNDFFQKVRKAYRERAEAFPERIKILDAEKSVAELCSEAWHLMGKAMEQKAKGRAKD